MQAVFHMGKTCGRILMLPGTGREHGRAPGKPAACGSAEGTLQRGGEDRQSAEEEAGDQKEVLRQDMYQGEIENVGACSHPDKPAAKADGEALVPEDQGWKRTQITVQQSGEHKSEQRKIGGERGEEVLQEAGLCGADPGEEKCGEGVGVFGGKAGAEKQTGEQTGQKDEEQERSDFSHR